MPFVPGDCSTNAVRDIMTNHINSGMSKMFESLLITLAFRGWHLCRPGFDDIR